MTHVLRIPRKLIFGFGGSRPLDPKLGGFGDGDISTSEDSGEARGPQQSPSLAKDDCPETFRIRLLGFRVYVDMPDVIRFPASCRSPIHSLLIKPIS